MRLLQKWLTLMVLLVFSALDLFSQSNSSIIWICSTDDHPWIRKSISSVNDQKPAISILIDPQKTVQSIDGFGGCFNELGWEALNSVSDVEKENILHNLFDPVSGCKFNICRMPVGANDYAVDWYSFNETPGDYEMNHFSIDRDRLRLIPYIKEAKSIRPDLKIWASPWSPPSWMKKNNHYACSSGAVNDLPPDKQGKEMEDMFILNDRTLSAYALYFSKFIREYKKEGIDIYAIHVQNEPNSCQNFPSCIWTPEALATFIGHYLGPEFKKDGLNTEIWLGTIERPQPERIDPILQDPDVIKYLTGVGFQWAGKGVIRHVNETYPRMKLMQTETECGNGSNDWTAMEHTFSLMKHYFNNGANSYMYWNMVLDHTGKSQWGWQQNSMITITEDHRVKYNPEFYLMKHFSYFIKPSARFLKIASDENCLAFLNPGNEIVIIYYNEKEVPVTKTFKTGDLNIHVELPKKSLSTFIVNAAAKVENLMVEYSRNPVGIDIKNPRFSWQMVAPYDERGYSQTAYEVIVKYPNGIVMWDLKKVLSDESVGILYAGRPLQATTRYDWSVIVWDQNGDSTSGSSWFETGLMNPDPGLSAWDGAKWIGGTNEDLVFYPQYLSIFNIRYTLAIEKGSTKASFILGANDLRLMDNNKNIYQLENGKDESYIKLELDISAVKGSKKGKAKFNVYRVGYTRTDSKTEPLQSFKISRSIINNDNKNQEHNFEISSVFGRISIAIDGNGSFTEDGGNKNQQRLEESSGRPARGGTSVNVNPMGSGGDFVTFGMLCDMGFAVDAGQKAAFSNVEVYNNRYPNNILFRENLDDLTYSGIYSYALNDVNSGFRIKEGKYLLNGLNGSIFIVADPGSNSTPMLRTEFNTNNKKIKEARLYVTARGIYEIYINGKRVGDDYYNPGLTQYNKTHMYQTYDVTDMINKGDNAIGAMLGEGWWSGLLGFGPNWNYFGDRQSILAKLVVTYDDNSTDIITSNDHDWKYYNDGPIIYSSLFMGEVYDATREAAIEGWSKPGFNDRQWKNATEVSLEGSAYIGTFPDGHGAITEFSFDRMSLVGQIGNNAGIFKTLTARSVKEARKGVFVYNMGQNLVGVPKITIAAGKAGHKIILRVAEMLYPDLPESGDNVGMIMTENYRAALSQDIYIMKDGYQVFQPHFTSHGYQYIEITGLDEPLPLEAVQGIVISSVKEITADYLTSNNKVNQLWSNIIWSNVDNFLSIPTDCPQRNERMGWSGDLSVFSRTATYVSNSDPFLTRHMYAMRDVQTPGGKFTDIAPVGGGFGGILWGSTGITVPWEVYQQYNDFKLLEEHYSAMSDYIDYLATTISKETGFSSDSQLGDWLGPQNDQLGSAFLATAYHIYDLWIMVNAAEILGKHADAEKYRKLYEEKKKFFNDTFLNEDHKTLGLTGGGFGFMRTSGTSEVLKLADTQTSYAVGLALGAFSDENIPYMAKNLAETVKRNNLDDNGISLPEYSLMTGFIGTAWISKALSDYGYNDLAYRLLQNNQYPSWLYAVDQGATTIWERLNGYTVENGFGGNNSMNSFNHYSFGAVGQWMIAYSLGIQRDKPGFKHFILRPEPDPDGKMTWAKGHYDCMYGRISSAWNTDNGTFIYKATIPANTTATLFVPAVSEKTVTEGGKPASEVEGIRFLRYEGGKAVYELTSGSYEFSSRLKADMLVPLQ